MNKIKSFTLNNGIKGAIVPINGLNAVTIEVFVKIGSKYENKSQAGMSHFLEHMAFKGTEKRPTPQIINKEIDTKGASYNAGTGHEMTSYYITTTKEHSKWAIELLSDILLNSKYKNEELEKEKGVIIEEIRMYKDNPMMGLSGEFIKFLYGGSKIGCWNIAGEVDDIKTVTRESLLNYRNTLFGSSDIALIAAGDVDDTLINEFRDNFDKLEKKKVVYPKIEIVVEDKKELIQKRDLEQGHFCIGGEAFTWQDDRKYAFRLLDIILAGNSSSRLHDKIREENALAYYVYSISESFKETGFWGIQSGVNLDKLDLAMEIAEKEILGLSDSLTEDELFRAKEYLLGKTKLAMDRSSFMADFMGQKLLLENSLETVEDEIEKYKAVTLKDLKLIAAELFQKDKLKRIILRK